MGDGVPLEEPRPRRLREPVMAVGQFVAIAAQVCVGAPPILLHTQCRV